MNIDWVKFTNIGIYMVLMFKTLVCPKHYVRITPSEIFELSASANFSDYLNQLNSYELETDKRSEF